MNSNNMFRKAQALPLNTIVIAILVIIVLLVIIVFFTGAIGDSGDQLDDQSPSNCDLNNPAIVATNYEEVITSEEYEDLTDDQKEEYSSVMGVSNCYGKR